MKTTEVREMTTPEQLRELADTMGNGLIPVTAKQFRAHADALDEIAAKDALQLTQSTTETVEASFYRYLRNYSATGADYDGPIVCVGLGDDFDYLTGADLDEAMAEALAKLREVKPTESAK
jgi:hypothetical protein